MSKPMLEKYEQILGQDPASTVFVELAKTLIEQGDHQRAIEVCQGGLEHHRRSVVGRVLWGKALINLGRPAEAMQQFDLAVSIDKDNPHAYNLIGEVLLRKGLYRSALPLLKKAVILQPNDGRVRQWLEQTQRALSGGPAPVLADFTDVDPAEIGSGATEVMRIPVGLGLDGDESTAEVPRSPPVDDQGPVTDPMAVVVPADPFEKLAASGPQVLMGLTATFDLLAAQQSEEATIIPSADLLTEVKKAQVAHKVAERSRWLEEVPSGIMEVPKLEPEPAPEPAPVRSGAPQPSGGLLDDVPELGEAPVARAPKATVSAQASEAIAKEYERELREKLAEKAKRKTFLQKNGVKLAVGAVLFAVLCAFAGSYGYTWIKNRGKDLSGALADAKLAIAQDTDESLKSALESLDHASSMDGANTEAWALKGYAHALLFADHGGEADDRAKALAALGKDKTREEAPGHALVVDYLVADVSAREAFAKELLASPLEQTEVKEAAGRLLLSRKKTDEGLKRLGRALELLPGNVRALVALGDYYLDAGDLDNALKFYAGPAAQISPKHVGRVVGAAETRLAMRAELDLALKEVEALSSSERMDPAVAARRQLVLGRLLAVNGRYPEGEKVLAEGEKAFADKGFEFKMAQGEAARSVGKMGEAQRSFEDALKLKPKNEEAKEALARVLVMRDREKEALRVAAEGGGRRLHLVRGVALARLGEWKRSRSELARTQLNGKFPTEAVVYLALADAAEEDPGKAEEILEKVLKAAKRGKAEVRVALATVYRQRGRLDKAREQLEEAAKDPVDVEGPCALGRLLFEEQKQVDAAIALLEKAVARNGSHGEARDALLQAYLAAGRQKDALAMAEAWLEENPGGASNAGLALALYHGGELQKAGPPSALAVKLDSQNPVVHRVRAMVLFGLGDGRAAFSELEKANKLDPKAPLTFCEIGHAFMRQGNGEMAARAYEAAGRDASKPGCAEVGGYYANAPGGGKAAAKELARLAKELPSALDRAFALAVLARVRAGMGAPKEAATVAAEAVALAPFMAVAHLSQGLIFAKQKENDAAIEALTRAVALDNALGTAHVALAEAFVRKDELGKAVEHYNRFLDIGGEEGELNRAKKAVTALKKKLATR